MTHFLASLKKKQGEEDPVKWEKIDLNTIDIEKTPATEQEEGAPPLSKEALSSSTSAKKVQEHGGDFYHSSSSACPVCEMCRPKSPLCSSRRYWTLS